MNLVNLILPNDLELTITVYPPIKEIDHPIPIYEVQLMTSAPGGVWTEVFGSFREMEVFLKGVQAGVRTVGKIFFPPSFREDWVRAKLTDAPFVLWPEENKEDG